MKRIVAGTLLGMFLGIIFFFRLPTLFNAVILILIFCILGGIAGLISREYTMTKAMIFGALLLLITVGSSIPVICDLVGVVHPPADNPLTGERVSGGFEGFRIMYGCDKGHYPWYYKELTDQALEEYCQNHSSAYCVSERDVI